MKVSMFGLGNIGFPMAKFLSSYNYKVSCFDKNISLVKKLKNNESFYLKNETKIKNYKNKLYYFFTPEECLFGTDITFITVPTPSLKNGKFSNKYILLVLDRIAEFIKKKPNNKPHIININSTISPGSFEYELIPFMEKKSLVYDFHYTFLYNPYFIALGNVFINLEKPDMILIGHSSYYSFNKIKNFYKKIYISSKLRFMSLQEAELAKLLVNCYITQKISFTNFVKDICDKSKINFSSKILDTLGADKRIGNHYFKQGLPFSGPCFPRDNIALKFYCKSKGVETAIPDGTIKVNHQTLRKLFNILILIKNNGFKKIGFYGISYKNNVNNLNDSIAIKLIQFCKKISLQVIYLDKFNSISRLHKKYSSLKELVINSEILFISYLDRELDQLNKLEKFNKNLLVWDMFEFVKSKKIRQFSNKHQFLKILNKKTYL
jgi:UDPglucose 6-dehydrogenase